MLHSLHAFLRRGARGHHPTTTRNEVVPQRTCRGRGRGLVLVADPLRLHPGMDCCASEAYGNGGCVLCEGVWIPWV